MRCYPRLKHVFELQSLDPITWGAQMGAGMGVAAGAVLPAATTDMAVAVAAFPDGDAPGA